jgi:hypothetical protein
VRVYLNIYLLAVLNIQNMERSMAGVDHLQSARVRRVVVAEKVAVVD